MEFILTVVLFLIILSILVLVHEAGHFIVARIVGVHVEEFGLGFPPRVKGWRRNRVLYSLNWLPLGGFVKLKGEQGEAQNDPDSFAAQPIGKRLVILVAGVAMNLVFAVLLLTTGFAVGMPQVVDTEAPGAASVREARIQVVHVVPHSPAERAGIGIGDIVGMVNGTTFERISEFQHYVSQRPSQELTLVLERGDETRTLLVKPERAQESEPARIGVGLAKTAVVSYPIHEAFVLAVKTTWVLTAGTFMMLGRAFSRLAFDGFVGPVGIATYTATAAQLGFSYVINLMAQLSVSLAVINVLPIPALDGGRVLFALIEKVRGRALRPVLENGIHLIGFFTLILLLLAVTVRDIGRLLPL